MKKVLILGADYSEIEIVNNAKAMGYYTIVTDYRTNWSESPAKLLADEAWNVSYSDIETLVKKCDKNNVDGCISGFSEFRIKNNQELCRQLGFPFYAENVDLDNITNKIKFKIICQACNIVTPRSFHIDDEKIEFPVIVKPSDNAGSRGISVCYDNIQLEKAYQLALNYSEKKQVLIEQYLTADEVMVYFIVHNGIVDLSAMCDRFMQRFDDQITQLPVGYSFPSKYLSVFEKFNRDKFEKLIRLLGIKNGLIAFQSFVINNDIIPFDPTYRLDGTMSYHISEYINHCNEAGMLINYSMTGNMGNDDVISKSENPFYQVHAFELPILLKNGTITYIQGLDEVKQMDEVIHVFVKQKIGDTFEKSADFLQIFCRIHMCCNNSKQTEKAIRKIFNDLRILDEKGEDMIIGKEYYINGGVF